MNVEQRRAYANAMATLTMDEMAVWAEIDQSNYRDSFNTEEEEFYFDAYAVSRIMYRMFHYGDEAGQFAIMLRAMLEFE
jgi:hypothetical protein